MATTCEQMVVRAADRIVDACGDMSDSQYEKLKVVLHNLILEAVLRLTHGVNDEEKN